MQNIILTVKAKDEILNYLGRCPWSDVNHLMVHLIQAKPFDPVKQEEISVEGDKKDVK